MKKLISLVLSVSMLLSFCFMAFAASPKHSDTVGAPSGDTAVVDSQDNDVHKDAKTVAQEATDGNVGTDFYILDRQASILSFQMCVKVPMVVGIAVANDGTTVVPGTNAYKIENHSQFAVNITKLDIEKPDSPTWALVASADIGNTVSADKNIAVQLKGIDLGGIAAEGQTLSSPWNIAAASGANPGELPVDIAAQANPHDGETTDTSTCAFTVSYTFAKAA